MKNVMHGGEQAKVAICACGTLHFTYGAVTLHFDRNEFVSFAESVRRLGALVGQDGQDYGVALTPPSHGHVCH